MIILFKLVLNWYDCGNSSFSCEIQVALFYFCHVSKYTWCYGKIRNSLTHSLPPHSRAQALHPGWDIRPQSNFASLPCLEISAAPHVKPNSSSSFITVLRQVVFCWPLFIFPVGVHLKTTSDILSLDILRT